jgi:hypothetical protein
MRRGCSVRRPSQVPCSISGFFQSEVGQFGCISCDSLSIGGFYQELEGQTSCRACAVNMQRYPGDASAANRSSCQCKEGVCSPLRSSRPNRR